MKKRIKVSYMVTVAGRYAFKTRYGTYTFITRREKHSILESEMEGAIKFKLRNRGLTIGRLQITAVEQLKTITQPT